MKEKIDREIRVKVQKSMHVKFEKACGKEYKTISEVIRELINEYIKIHP